MREGRAYGVLGAALSALLVAACGPPAEQPPPTPGTLSLTLKPTAPAVADLTLDKAVLDLENLAVLGDVTADARTAVGSVQLALDGGTLAFPLTEAPQGLYSRVRLELEKLSMQGQYKGRAISIALAYLDIYIDFRSDTGREVGPGASADFALDIDSNVWFAGVNLDAAIEPFEDHIEINSHDNVAVGQQIIANMPTSLTLEGGAATDTQYGEQSGTPGPQ